VKYLSNYWVNTRDLIFHFSLNPCALVYKVMAVLEIQAIATINVDNFVSNSI